MQRNVLEVKFCFWFLLFFFVLLVMRKVQKVESINIKSNCKRTSKKRRLVSGKYEKVESVNTKNDYKTTSKK